MFFVQMVALMSLIEKAQEFFLCSYFISTNTIDPVVQVLVLANSLNVLRHVFFFPSGELLSSVFETFLAFIFA